ncbi:ABC transporter permease [Candidatus Babeliales bacterium]|nr:ABC transporter permease [Candidatus Babeliales bacterium]
MFSNNLKIFNALIRRDFKIIRRRLKDSLINNFIFVGLEALLFYYFVPYVMGFDRALIPSIFLGSIIFMLPIIAFNYGITDVSDLSGNRFIDYKKSLPLPINWFVGSYIISYFIAIGIIFLPSLVIAKIILGSFLDLSQMRIIPLILMCVALILFFALFLLISIFGPDTKHYFKNFWPRVLMPLMFLSPLWYTWKGTLKISSKLSIFLLFNPFTYCVEGLRSALWGDELFLSTYICILVLFTSVVFMIFVFRKVFVKRLNLIGS